MSALSRLAAWWRGRERRRREQWHADGYMWAVARMEELDEGTSVGVLLVRLRFEQQNWPPDVGSYEYEFAAGATEAIERRLAWQRSEQGRKWRESGVLKKALRADR